MTEKIHVLLPVHNRRETTRRFIKCLSAQTCSSFHLILIDDGSTDGSADMVLDLIPGTTVIRGKGNWWWAGSLQQGINWLKKNQPGPDDVILLTNDDALIDTDFVQKGRDLVYHNEDSLIQARVLSLDGNETLDEGMTFDPRHLTFKPAKQGGPINCLTTNGLFIKWKHLLKIGDFHPKLLPHYLSDYEYTIRAYRRGLRLMVPHRLSLRWDRESSGYRDFTNDSLSKFVSKLFSKKCPTNPIYWTTFALLAGQPVDIPGQIARIWWRAVRLMVRQLLLSIKSR
jgi:GT2 family glycosyltransferase